MKTKKATKQDNYDELERVCRLIAYSKIDDNDLIFCRKALQAPLEAIAQMRKAEEDKKAERIEAKARAERELLCTKRERMKSA